VLLVGLFVVGSWNLVDQAGERGGVAAIFEEEYREVGLGPELGLRPGLAGQVDGLAEIPAAL
jgi:hypothetical protein